MVPQEQITGPIRRLLAHYGLRLKASAAAAVDVDQAQPQVQPALERQLLLAPVHCYLVEQPQHVRPAIMEQVARLLAAL